MVRTFNHLFIAQVFLLVVWPKYWLFPVGSIAVSPFSLLTLLLICALMALMIVNPAISKIVLQNAYRNKLLLGSWLLWCTWRLVADVFGVTPSDSLGTTIRSIVYAESFMVTGLLAFSTLRVARSVPIVLVSVAAFSTAVGLYEYQVQRTFANIMGISFAGLREDAVFNATRQAIEFFRDGAYRAASVFSHSIVFSQFIGATAPIAIHLVRFGKGRARLSAGMALIAVPIALIIAGSRSGYVVAVTSVGMYFFLRFLGNKIPPSRLFIIIIGIGLSGILFLSPLQSAIEMITRGETSAERGSSMARNEMITRGLDALQDRPTTGYGHGLAAEVAGLTGRNDIKTIDNYYLSTTVDFGIVGALIFACFLGCILLTFLRSLNSAPDMEHSDLARSYIAFSLAIFVGQYVLSIPDNWSLVLLISLAASSMRPSKTLPGAPVKADRSGRNRGPRNSTNPLGVHSNCSSGPSFR